MKGARALAVAAFLASAFGMSMCNSTPKDNVQCCPLGPATSTCRVVGGAASEAGVCSTSTTCSSCFSAAVDSYGCAIWQPSACTSDASNDAPTPDASTACTPTTVTFEAPPYIPPSPPTNACAPSDATAMYDACFGDNNSTTACQAFINANANCAACILTPDTASTWGAVVSSAASGSLVYSLNVGGCIAIAQGTTTCAAAEEANDACYAAECEGCFSSNTTDIDATLGGYEACLASAQANACAPYVTALCDGDAGSFSACLADFQTAYSYYAALFCESD